MKAEVISNVIDHTVHFSDEDGNVHQGVIVALWREGKGRYDENAGCLRITVLCNDRKYRDVWLGNVTAGARPETEEEMKARLKRRREKEGQ